MTRSTHDITALEGSVAALDWPEIASGLDARGYATTGPILRQAECRKLIDLYADDRNFRRVINMRRHGFGEGEYKYFSYPLPPVVDTLRHAFYPRLAEIANRWRAALKQSTPYPGDLEAYLARCHEAGQRRPTPLLLKYESGDYNRLHQDLYGELAFPLQMTFLLSAPDTDHSGGEFVLVEQRPRMQSRAEVVPLAQGEAVMFANNERPQKGTRGTYRVKLRHGVSRVRSGERLTLGIIFHDAA